ncbi:hypothetical protein BDV95DRAFT_179750 [Massariosphaeria phaeospora]|uniref:Uncharacterized protein n=1 Tax=Massariosphaeria phaeospora TaxID=100035 RepID=A0A7C8I526_9PLEO|nr:hypothetical protein BDV95DRAFT_179750 [Massariosphaeria phaeospora]
MAYGLIKLPEELKLEIIEHLASSYFSSTRKPLRTHEDYEEYSSRPSGSPDLWALTLSSREFKRLAEPLLYRHLYFDGKPIKQAKRLLLTLVARRDLVQCPISLTWVQRDSNKPSTKQFTGLERDFWEGLLVLKDMIQEKISRASLDLKHLWFRDLYDSFEASFALILAICTDLKEVAMED